MNLYLISQDVNIGFDTYDSAVVAAKSEDDARKIYPAGPGESVGLTWRTDHEWCRPEYVKVKYIGKAAKEVKEGVICSSFNAGW